MSIRQGEVEVVVVSCRYSSCWCEVLDDTPSAITVVLAGVHAAPLTVRVLIVNADALGLLRDHANAPVPVSVADFNETVLALALNRPNANTPTTSASTESDRDEVLP